MFKTYKLVKPIKQQKSFMTFVMIYFFSLFTSQSVLANANNQEEFGIDFFVKEIHNGFSYFFHNSSKTDTFECQIPGKKVEVFPLNYIKVEGYNVSDKKFNVKNYDALKHCLLKKRTIRHPNSALHFSLVFDPGVKYRDELDESVTSSLKQYIVQNDSNVNVACLEGGKLSDLRIREERVLTDEYQHCFEYTKVLKKEIGEKRFSKYFNRKKGRTASKRGASFSKGAVYYFTYWPLDWFGEESLDGPRLSVDAYVVNYTSKPVTCSPQFSGFSLRAEVIAPGDYAQFSNSVDYVTCD